MFDGPTAAMIGIGLTLLLQVGAIAYWGGKVVTRVDYLSKVVNGHLEDHRDGKA